MDDFMPDEIEMQDLVDASGPKGCVRESIDEASALPLKHFKLGSHPFADSVNPEYFFRTEAHEEAFIAMKQCIEDHISLGLTTAISGTGKTLLTQVLLQELDPRKYQAILVLAYPGMSKTALLKEIMVELGAQEIPTRAKAHDLIEYVQKHIIEQHRKGIRLVMMIDEVHFLQADALHIVRTLSNIEAPTAKLMTVLLFGEQVFMQKMKRPEYRSIFSRMFARAEIRPLNVDEVQQYVKFRMMVAGGRADVIAPAAMTALYERSQGIPREINRICHNALGMAAREGKKQVDEAVIEQIPAALPIERG